MLNNSQHNKSGQIDLKVTMSRSNLINIGWSLSLNKLSSFALTISIYLMINLKRLAMARNIWSDSYPKVGENVSLNSTPCICEKYCVISRALYRAILPSCAYLTLKIYFNPIAF